MEGLVTQRLAIRRFQASDGPRLHSYLSRPEAVRFEPYPIQSTQDCERLAGERVTDPAFWAVCLRETGELVGNLYLSMQQPESWRTYELGYVFHPAYWGRGFATESAGALVAEYFAGGAHRMLARCNPQNTASWRLLERLRFRREGHFLRSASFATDEAGQPIWHDTYQYACLAEEWT